MSSVVRGCVVLILVVGLISCATGPAEHPETMSSNHADPPAVAARAGASYYETLQSLVGPMGLAVRPKADGRDFNLVDPEKGTAGVRFGDSMDDVVNFWGKPCGISLQEHFSIWELRIGACRFGFVAGRLKTVGVHSATLPEAYLPNGITFQSSYDQVKQAFGKPIEETPTALQFETANGYDLRFQFTYDLAGKLKLIAIDTSHPEARR